MMGQTIHSCACLLLLIFTLAAVVPTAAKAGGTKKKTRRMCSKACEAEFIDGCLAFHKQDLQKKAKEETSDDVFPAAFALCSQELEAGVSDGNQRTPTQRACKKGCALTHSMRVGMLKVSTANDGGIDQGAVTVLTKENWASTVTPNRSSGGAAAGAGGSDTVWMVSSNVIKGGGCVCSVRVTYIRCCFV